MNSQTLQQTQEGLYEELATNIPECRPDDVTLVDLLHCGHFTEVYKAFSANTRILQKGLIVAVKRNKGTSLTDHGQVTKENT